MPPPAPRTIRIIIPALNEATELPETLRHARALPELREIILVDGGSTDRTREIAAAHGCQVLAAPPSRGGQLRVGAAQATGDVLLLLHADTWLPPQAGRATLDALRDPRIVGGGFWKAFRDPLWFMRGARTRCALLFWTTGRILGDQALFIRREVLERAGGVPDLPLMEDVELCRRLRPFGRLTLADATVTTSARRFRQHGVLRTYLRMAHVTLRHWLGAKPEELRRIYEQK